MIETRLLPERDRWRIGFLADTHVHAGRVPFPEAVVDALRGVDQIVHLGDMGEASTLDRLAELAPVLATRGANDPASDPRIADARLLIAGPSAIAAAFELGSLVPGAKSEGFVLPDGDVAAELRSALGRAVSVVAFARTHTPAVFARDGVLFVNPGSPNLPGAGVGTVAIVTIERDQVRAEIVLLPGGAK